MVPMKMFSQNDPLTDAELDRLGDFLKSCKGGEVPKYRVCRRDCY